MNEDDGSGVIMAFQVMSMVPVVGAPFNLAMAAYDFGEGDYLGAGLGLASTALDVVGIGAAADALAVARELNMAGEVAGNVNMARPGLAIGNGVGKDTRAATIIREIKKGERIQDILNEAKDATYIEDIEHAVVSLRSRKRFLIKGGRDGIDIRNIPGVKRIIAHTHPVRSGPKIVAPNASQEDLDALMVTGQHNSRIWEQGDWFKFGNRGNK